MALHMLWGATREKIAVFCSCVVTRWAYNFEQVIAQEGDQWLNQQLPVGKTYRSFDSFVIYQEEGCLMGTMRLPLEHQTEQGLLSWIFLIVILKRLAKLCCCTYHGIYLYPKKVSKIWIVFSFSVCVSGITVYLEYEQHLGLFRVQYV